MTTEAKSTLRLTVNGHTVEVESGTTLLEAARQAGVHIPTLCHHPNLPARAVCRMCLVDVVGERKPQAACAAMAKDGDVVETDTPGLRISRQANAEWLLARHPNDCMRCEVSGNCALQSLVHEHQWQERWPEIAIGSAAHPEHVLIDHTSPSIWRDLNKCIECGLCADVCGDGLQEQFIIGFAERSGDRLPVTVFDKPLSETNCISCGLCTLVCPVGALTEAPHWHDVLHVLDSRKRISVVQVAPATRIAISEEFGMEPGTVSTGRLINALRAIGFDYVFDTNFAADLTIMEESTELLERLRTQNDLPLFTSCCPGWINWVELNRPDLIPHLSTTKSPQQMHGALSKRGAFARSLSDGFESGDAEPYVVSVMPCTAKKDEAERPDMAGDLDRVLTTRELARMIRARGIAFGALPDDGEFDNPLGESTGAGQIFGASGGVMEAIARTASQSLSPNEEGPIEWHQLRGVEQSIKTAIVPGVGKVAVCNGIASAQRMLETDAWRETFVAIEVMACVGGCLGGGGEPKSADPHILQKRAKAVYAVDASAPRRRSSENAYVRKLYETELDHPNSAKAKAFLHTSFAARRSKRSVLMQFLDCVDRRDGSAAARLFDADGLWRTSSPFGDVRGRSSIEKLINESLPPRLGGPRYARHRMASLSDPDDLTVITPAGQTCAFTLEYTASSENQRGAPKIKALTRSTN